MLCESSIFPQPFRKLSGNGCFKISYIFHQNKKHVLKFLKEPATATVSFKDNLIFLTHEILLLSGPHSIFGTQTLDQNKPRPSASPRTVSIRNTTWSSDGGRRNHLCMPGVNERPGKKGLGAVQYKKDETGVLK